MAPEDGRIRDLVAVEVAKASPAQREALAAWIDELLRIRQLDAPRLAKLKLTLRATVNREAIQPLLKALWSEIKRIGWSERGLPARFAIAASVAALTLSGQGAGIAALGGAIGVPLFIVFGAGGALAGVIVDECRKGRGRS